MRVEADFSYKMDPAGLSTLPPGATFLNIKKAGPFLLCSGGPVKVGALERTLGLRAVDLQTGQIVLLDEEENVYPCSLVCKRVGRL